MGQEGARRPCEPRSFPGGLFVLRQTYLLRSFVSHIVKKLRECRVVRWRFRSVSWVDCFVYVIGRVIRQPNLALIILPHKSFGRIVDRQQRRLSHHRCTEFRIAKYDDSACAHVDTEFLSRSGMVNFGEYGEPGALP